MSYPLKSIVLALGILLIGRGALSLHDFLKQENKPVLIESVDVIAKGEHHLAFPLIVGMLDLQGSDWVVSPDHISKMSEKLKQYRIFEKCSLYLNKPSQLVITYQLKTPKYELLDYVSSAVDKQGDVIPLSPYYNLNLPKLYLGLHHQKNQHFKERLVLAAAIVNECQKLQMEHQSLQVDVSNAFKKSFGRKEVIVTFTDAQSQPIAIRIAPLNFSKQLHNLPKILTTLVHKKPRMKPKIIDLRLDQLAYITEDDKLQ